MGRCPPPALGEGQPGRCKKTQLPSRLERLCVGGGSRAFAAEYPHGKATRIYSTPLGRKKHALMTKKPCASHRQQEGCKLRRPHTTPPQITFQKVASPANHGNVIEGPHERSRHFCRLLGVVEWYNVALLLQHNYLSLHQTLTKAGALPARCRSFNAYNITFTVGGKRFNKDQC